ncbi:hypothetical protein VTH82DRAFT_1849 [Thermothelomyces myriococcoides]
MIQSLVYLLDPHRRHRGGAVHLSTERDGAILRAPRPSIAGVVSRLMTTQTTATPGALRKAPSLATETMLHAGHLPLRRTGVRPLGESAAAMILDGTARPGHTPVEETLTRGGHTLHRDPDPRRDGMREETGVVLDVTATGRTEVSRGGGVHHRRHRRRRPESLLLLRGREVSALSASG